MGTLKIKKMSKTSGSDEFWPKHDYHQISSSVGQHALKVRLGWECLKWKKCQKQVEVMSFGQKMSIIKFHPVLANMLLRSGWAGNTYNAKKCQKQSGSDEFWPKNEYHQTSSSFGQHALNPFDTKPMAKIAVKMSIMRVVKFMSSWDNDFTSWPKHHQLFFWGQSVELPLSLHWFSWLPPGGNQALSIWEIWSKHSQSFDVWGTFTATGVKCYRNRVTCISQVMRTQGPQMPCTPQVLPSKYCQR